MLRDVYDLLTARRHDLPAKRLTPEEWDVYRLGYDYALIIVLRVLQAATENHALFRRTRRRQQRADALARRERRDRLRLLLTRACARWHVDHRRFCGAAADWVLVDAANRPIELRCHAHRTVECHALPADVGAIDPGEREWMLDWETRDLRTKKNGPDGP